MSRKNRRSTKNNKNAKRGVMIVVILLLAVMSVNILRLYQKDQEYALKEENLNAQYAEEVKRSEDLIDFEGFTKTLKYVEQVAREKLGLVFKNEIVFRIKED